MTTGHSSVEPITDKMAALITPEVRLAIEALVAKAKFDRSYDVKGVANRSVDGKTVFVDRSVPRTMHAPKAFNPERTLVWHEMAEWYLMHKLDLPYEKAHSLATEEFEKPHVLAMGLKWPKYQEEWGGEIDANEKKRIKSPPPNLDETPYKARGKGCYG